MRTTRQTRQKAVLLDEMGKLERLFTPDELHAKVQSRLPRLGIATVYRFLHQSAKEGVIHRYRHGRKWVYSMRAKSVAHFICERCGQMRHLDLADFDLGGVLKREDRLLACHFQLDVFGVCERCSKKDRRDGY